MSVIDYDLTKIKGIIFDVDGVLSTDILLLDTTGEPMRFVNTKDGYAMQLAVKQGLVLSIITGGFADALRIRFKTLGIRYIYMRSKVKSFELKKLIEETKLQPEEMIFVGDDIPDLEVMQMVGLPACPADAVPEIKAVAKYISPYNGGHGVARDIIEQVLKAQGKWMGDQSFGW